MKKIFYILLLTAITLQGQTTGVNKLKIAANPEKTTAPRVLVQETNGDVGYVAKSTLQTDISGKVDKVVGKELSSNDYTTVEKTKLSGIASGAEVNVNADWNATSGDAQILNKPSIPSISGLATETFVNNGLSTKENTIAPGTTSQYWRGDKTWQTLNSTSVGLGNVNNTTDAAKPISTATQTALNLKENVSNKNIANGYAGLGSDGKLISNQLPAIAITDTYVVNTQASMLALTAETGDVAIRTDLNKSFILQGATASVLGNWRELLSPTGGATSVFGRTGAVVANAGDYTADQISETASRKFQTLAQQTYNDATSSIQTQLNAKANDSNTVHKTGTETITGYKTFTGADNGQIMFTNTAMNTTKYAAIGYSSDFNLYSGTGFRFLADYPAGATSSNPVFTILTNGYVGIGTTLPSEKLNVAGNGLFTGSVTATGFFQSSDSRLKDIISRDGDVIKYKWKDKRDDKIHIGYVAQEVQKENPDQVNADEKGILSVNYIEILVQKIKDLENRIKQLEK